MEAGLETGLEAGPENRVEAAAASIAVVQKRPGASGDDASARPGVCRRGARDRVLRVHRLCLSFSRTASGSAGGSEPARHSRGAGPGAAGGLGPRSGTGRLSPASARAGRGGDRPEPATGADRSAGSGDPPDDVSRAGGPFRSGCHPPTRVARGHGPGGWRLRRAGGHDRVGYAGGSGRDDRPVTGNPGHDARQRAAGLQPRTAHLSHAGAVGLRRGRGPVAAEHPGAGADNS